MDLTLTVTQLEIAMSARAWLARTYPPHRIAAIADGKSRVDLSTWDELTRQGWLDEDLAPVELGLLAMESGYALQPTPWLATVSIPPPLFEPRPSAVVHGDFTVADGLLSGRAERVWTTGAQRLVVAAGDVHFAVEAAERSVSIEAKESFDPLRPMSTVRLEDVAGQLLPDVGVSLSRRRTALFACEAVGVAQRAMDFAVEYAKIREQFGRPIGTFQAVAHQLADGYVELELARSLALRAAWLLGTDEPDDLAAAASVAASRTAALRCCEIAMQTLGGIGATWEHPLHLWLRRAWWLQSMGGLHPDAHERIAAALLDMRPATVASG